MTSVVAPAVPAATAVLGGQARSQGAQTIGTADTVYASLALPLPAALVPPVADIRCVLPWVGGSAASAVAVTAKLLEDGVQINEAVWDIGASGNRAITVEKLDYVTTPGAHTYTVALAASANTITVQGVAPPATVESVLSVAASA